MSSNLAAILQQLRLDLQQRNTPVEPDLDLKDLGLEEGDALKFRSAPPHYREIVFEGLTEAAP